GWLWGVRQIHRLLGCSSFDIIAYNLHRIPHSENVSFYIKQSRFARRLLKKNPWYAYLYKPFVHAVDSRRTLSHAHGIKPESIESEWGGRNESQYPLRIVSSGFGKRERLLDFQVTVYRLADE